MFKTLPARIGSLGAALTLIAILIGSLACSWPRSFQGKSTKKESNISQNNGAQSPAKEQPAPDSNPVPAVPSTNEASGRAEKLIIGRYREITPQEREALQGSITLPASWQIPEEIADLKQAVVLSWPGVSVLGKFQGRAIGVILRRLPGYAPMDPSWRSHYQVKIDNDPPKNIALQAGQDFYSLADNLSAGEHTIALTKITEHVAGIDVFGGFIPQTGGKLLPVDAPASLKKIIFIGDSVLTGYGDLFSDTADKAAQCSYAPQTQDLSKNYGFLVTQAFQAHAHYIAIQGRGMYRTYSGPASSVTPAAPEFFERTIPDEPGGPWDQQGFVPDLVFINLGSNDLKSPPPAPPFDEVRFKSTYVAFLKKLRGLFPLAKILCAFGPTLHDQYLVTARKMLPEIINEFNDPNCNLIEFQEDDYSLGVGCAKHPNAEVHKRLSKQLQSFLQNEYGWQLP